MSSEMTAGGWIVVDNSWEISTVYDTAGKLMATCQISDEVTEETQDLHEGEKGRRARLIAAAPDLLEALQGLLAGVVVREGEGGRRSYILQPVAYPLARCLAQAAIAKALNPSDAEVGG